MNYRADIDGLRAIAVLSVVAFHAFPDHVRGGFIGVDVFFVISGFLITSILVRQAQFSLVEFYTRRVLRIFPALVVVLLACFVVGKAVLFADELQQLGKHIAAGAGFVSNLVLWRESGYFDASAESKPLLHLWSLGIEEQFYVVWPLLVAVILRLRINGVATCVAIAAASFALNIANVGDNPVAAFYSPISRCWELLIGSLLAFPSIAGRLDRLPGSSQSLLSVTGHLCLLAGLIAISPNRAFPGFWALLPTVGAACIIAAGPQASLNRWLLSIPPLVGIGLISYPLYLWHWPLLSFAQILEGARPNDTIRGGLAFVAIGLAALTYRLIERPIRRSRRKQRIATWAALSCSIVALLALVQFSTELRSQRDRGGFAMSQLASETHPWRYAANETCRKRFPFEPAKSYGWWFCMLGEDRSPTIVLLGDSRTNDYYPGIARSFPKDNVLSIGTCAAVWEDSNPSAPAPSFSPCSGNRPSEQMAFINKIVEQSPSLRLAVIGSLPTEFDEVFVERLRLRIHFLETRGIKVVLIGPTVGLGYNIRNCFSRLDFRQPASCETGAEQYRKSRDGFQALSARIGATNPAVSFFDPNVFCSETVCSFKMDGFPILRDGFGHLSEHASIHLVEMMREQLGQAVD